jgi:WD40 repeat protein
MTRLTTILFLTALLGLAGCGGNDRPPEEPPPPAMTETPHWEIIRRLEGHTGPVTAVAFIGNDRLISISETDQTLRLWNLRNSRQMSIVRMQTPPHSMAVDAKGRHAWIADAQGAVSVWPLTEGKIGSGRPVIQQGGQQLTLSRNSRWMALTGDDQPLSVHEVPGGVTIKQMSDSDRIAQMDFSVGKELMVATGPNGSVRLWSIGDNEVQSISTGIDARSNGVDYAPNGRHVAVAYESGHMVLLNMQRRDKVIRRGHIENAAAYTVLFHPREPYLFSGHHDHKLHLWDGGNGRLITSLPGHDGPVHCLQFNRTGTLLASGSQDQQILIWSDPKPSDLSQQANLGPLPSRPDRDTLLGRPNLLLNPKANQKQFFWETRGSAFVTLWRRGNPGFGLQVGGGQWQDVALNGADGKTVLLLGEVAAETPLPNSRHGRPYLYATLHADDEEPIARLTHPKTLIGTSNQPYIWSTAWAAFPIPKGKGVKRLRFHMAQAVDGDARLPAAYFDNLGVYLFDTPADANAFMAKLRRGR